MIKIVFVCHGNICRSPMAEYLFKNMVKEEGLENLFLIESRATSSDALGRSPHSGTVGLLDNLGIDMSDKVAIKLKKKDYEKYDFFIGMDCYNRKDMVELFKGDPDNKVFLLLDFTDEPNDIDDPWYTKKFDKTYEEVSKGCKALLNKMKKRTNK